MCEPQKTLAIPTRDHAGLKTRSFFRREDVRPQKTLAFPTGRLRGVQDTFVFFTRRCAASRLARFFDERSRQPQDSLVFPTRDRASLKTRSFSRRENCAALGLARFSTGGSCKPAKCPPAVRPNRQGLSNDLFFVRACRGRTPCLRFSSQRVEIRPDGPVFCAGVSRSGSNGLSRAANVCRLGSVASGSGPFPWPLVRGSLSSCGQVKAPRDSRRRRRRRMARPSGSSCLSCPSCPVPKGRRRPDPGFNPETRRLYASAGVSYSSRLPRRTRPREERPPLVFQATPASSSEWSPPFRSAALVSWIS